MRLGARPREDVNTQPESWSTAVFRVGGSEPQQCDDICNGMCHFQQHRRILLWESYLPGIRRGSVEALSPLKKKKKRDTCSRNFVILSLSVGLEGL